MFDFVVKKGNNVERVYLKIFVVLAKSNVASTLLPFLATCSICLDFVERTKFRSTLLPKAETMSKQRLTLSNQHWPLSKESFDL